MMVNLSQVSDSWACISSISIMSFTMSTHRDKGGTEEDFQNLDMSCQAAESKKRSKLAFCDLTDLGSIDSKAIVCDGVRHSL